MMKPKINYRRGDVILVLFPHADLITAKTRPALVIQANNLNTGLPQVVVAMISSRIFRANHPSRVQILHSSPEGKKSGLLSNSVNMTDNIATIFESEIYCQIGSIPMLKVDIA